MYSEDIKEDNLWLMKGDCLERMKDIPSGSVDLILTDPPYAKTQNVWDSVIPLDDMWEQLKRIIKHNGAVLLFGQNSFSFKLGLSNEQMFRYSIVWEKNKSRRFLKCKKDAIAST